MLITVFFTGVMLGYSENDGVLEQHSYTFLFFYQNVASAGRSTNCYAAYSRARGRYTAMLLCS